MISFTIPENLEPEAREYMQNVLQMLEDNGVIEDVDNAALQMLAYNYSTFIKASKIVEQEGLTITSDRGNIAEHPAVKIGRDAQASALKVMTEFGLTAKSRSKMPRFDDNNGEDSPLETFIKSRKQ